MSGDLINSDKHFKGRRESLKEAPDQSEIVHMLYDAVADNSLWPEMISELMEHLEGYTKRTGSQDIEEFESLVQHFQRAMRLSENVVDLQERYTTLDGVLNSLSFGICVYDYGGNQLYSNESANASGVNKIKIDDRYLKLEDTSQGRGDILPMLDRLDNTEVAIIPVSQIQNTKLPANAAALVISMPKLAEHTMDHFQSIYYLTDAESHLLHALHQFKNLRKAADLCKISYESARTYLKRIFAKTSCKDQASLLALLDNNPVTLIEQLDLKGQSANSVRNNFHLKDGRNLEYFQMGPASGKTLLHFDALTGVAIDTLGDANRYLPVLEELKIQIIVPCRPGTFRSDFNKMLGLSGQTPDILQLIDHLKIDKVTLISQAFGSCSALAFAANAPSRVEKSILCAPSYPRHEPPDWRQMDLFYIIGGVIGRRAPALMRAIIPFLMRSVMQNTAKYLERHIARSNCPADVMVLSSPTLQRRIPEMLAARTALGTEGLVQENFLNTHGWDFELSKIESPVHIFQGELDNVSHPQGSRILANALPNGTYHSFPELGQYMLFSEWPWIFEACAKDDVDLEKLTKFNRANYKLLDPPAD